MTDETLRETLGQELSPEVQELIEPVRKDLIRRLKEIDPKMVVTITLGGGRRASQIGSLIDPHTDIAKDTFKDKVKDGKGRTGDW